MRSIISRNRSTFIGITYRRLTLLMGCAWLLFSPFAANAEKALLKDGRELEGRFTRIPKTAEDPLKSADPNTLTPILLCDNELTRTMVPFSRLKSLDPKATNIETIRIDQPVAESGLRIGSVGPILRITPFDEYGRRILSMNTTKGPIDVVQGITTITPIYTQVRALRGTRSFIWDMRVATSSIPRETLHKIIYKSLDRNSVDQRLTLIRLLMQAERYHDARAELTQLVKDFPKEQAAAEQMANLDQIAARILLGEILTRKDAGQHRLAYGFLKSFPTNGVPGNILQQVRQELGEYGQQEQARIGVIKRLRGLVTEISDSETAKLYTTAIAEIEAELSLNTLDRVAAFRRLESDPNLSNEQKIALAVSGWLLGADDADPNPKIAMSLIEARGQVRAYLNEPIKAKRDEIYQQMSNQTGSGPQLIASLIKRMKPPIDTPLPTDKDYYELEVPGAPGEANSLYYCLLPPEYDPHRTYPAIVTLNGAGTTPQQQMDWWGGAASDKGRLGQASRHGYIVIAPVWAKDHQLKYNGSPDEHDIVLSALRDACRRFAIDTDRVFLSGHSMGGDAAWDIGVAHPDLWAGVIPIVATVSNYVLFYKDNAKDLPMYFVAGEMDGGKIQTNGPHWDYSFVRNFDLTIVEYRGRGHEHFSDEILRIFDWMGRKQRNFFPKEFKAATKRPFDNYFWWVEMEQLPALNGARAFPVEGTINANNGINIKAPGAVSVWLAPEMLDFAKPTTVTINGKAVSRKPVQADLRVLLDDVRTRGERRHPFWARIDANAK